MYLIVSIIHQEMREVKLLTATNMKIENHQHQHGFVNAAHESQEIKINRERNERNENRLNGCLRGWARERARENKYASNILSAVFKHNVRLLYGLLTELCYELRARLKCFVDAFFAVLCSVHLPFAFIPFTRLR